MSTVYRNHTPKCKFAMRSSYLLEVDCHLDGVYLNLSEVYLFTLPPPLRNTELALRCLKKALRLKTDSPRTHYRMGLALFKVFKTFSLQNIHWLKHCKTFAHKHISCLIKGSSTYTNSLFFSQFK